MTKEQRLLINSAIEKKHRLEKLREEFETLDLEINLIADHLLVGYNYDFWRS